MQILVEEIDELLSRAKYIEKKQPNSPIQPEYWTRLTAVCDQVRQLGSGALKNVVPDEAHKTWAEAALCLEAIHEVVHGSQPVGNVG
ncbi:MAG: hypothetical protein ACRD4R_06990 [Candidatus Acidiferrales bacterium]